MRQLQIVPCISARADNPSCLEEILSFSRETCALSMRMFDRRASACLDLQTSARCQRLASESTSWRVFLTNLSDLTAARYLCCRCVSYAGVSIPVLIVFIMSYPGQVGGKGGVGKTSLSASLAVKVWAHADTPRKQRALLDAASCQLCSCQPKADVNERRAIPGRCWLTLLSATFLCLPPAVDSSSLSRGTTPSSSRQTPRTPSATRSRRRARARRSHLPRTVALLVCGP